jgi:RNA polymerase sigma factor (sigma-70 family)
VLQNALSTFEEVVAENRRQYLLDLLKAEKMTPRKKLEKKHLEEKISSALSELEPKEKLILELRAFHGKKYREISKIARLSIGNVSSLVKRTLKKIKNKMQ